NGYMNESVYLPLTQSTAPKETNIANCIARMAKIPSVVKTAQQNLHNPFHAHTETAIKQNRGAISFYEQEIYDFIGQTPQLAAIKSAAAPVIASLKSFQDFLEKELLPNANGEWRIGPEKFAR